MANNAIETVMGAVVLAVAGGFLYFAYSTSSVKSVDGYQVKADFTNITGIGVGSDVRVGGIKVGVVEKLALDPTSYQAVATMRIDQTVALPKDSSAAVQSAGLLGDKFVAIEPGGDEKNMKDGDAIAITQSSVSLEEMIGKFVFSGGGVGDSAEAKEPETQDHGDHEDAEPSVEAPEALNPLSSGIE
ncbi:MAG: outer membrane lipid asymmetry maintenance protein MlaD [Alphaproteobacteria bacterium]|nr:outer membrane lipid asymmetry maintenance protein MlaD [Alphaproteobacteria bacterium]